MVLLRYGKHLNSCDKMVSKRKLAITFAIIFIIFSVGFVLRVESTHLTGIPADEKAYYEDQNGLPYAYEFDSYYNYRMTGDYIDHGYLGDTRVNGKSLDLHVAGGLQEGAVTYPPLIVYLTVLLYKFVNLFVNVPLIVACFWVPAIIGPLAGIVAYLFVRRFTNEYGAVAAGILTVTVPIYFFRTVPGWFDTDMFNLLFPLLVMWFINEAVCAKNNKNLVGFSFLAAISTFLFAEAWNGWLYVVGVIIASSFLYIVLAKLKKFETKNVCKVLGSFTIFTLILTVPTGLLELTSFSSVLHFLNAAGGTSVVNAWPNLVISISELQKPSINELISDGGFVIFGGILGLLWTFRVMITENMKKRYLNKMTWFFYLFLITWTLIGLFSLREGVRFILVLLPPLIVFSGLMVGICVGYLDILQNSKFKLFQDKNLIKIISILILVLVVTPGIINAYSNFSNLKPLANDDLYDSAVWINSSTPNDTVIISEWDYGHFLAATADRSVSADGGVNSFSIYWIDKAFATDNESLSLGIFNMLVTSGDKGYKTLNNYTENTTQSVGILNNILGVNKETAKVILMDNYGLNQTTSEDVLQYTHPTNPRHFVVLTSGVESAYWIFYFGTWDFNKMQSRNYTYSYGNIEINKEILTTDNNITMDLKTGNVTWYGKTPYCVINVTSGNVEKRYIDKNSDFCIVLLMDSMQSVVIDKQFENSTFTKLWLERSNSTYFKSIYENQNAAIWEPVKNYV